MKILGKTEKKTEKNAAELLLLYLLFENKEKEKKGK